MIAIWPGLDTVRAAVAGRLMVLMGRRELAASTQIRLALSPFAKERKLTS